MDLRRRDADVEGLVAASALFRWSRAALAALDAAAASSAAVRRLRNGPLPAAGAVLIVASIVHAVIVAFEPAEIVPAGRYAFAIAGAVAGALLMGAIRPSR